jgi:hypothetical protein
MTPWMVSGKVLALAGLALAACTIAPPQAEPGTLRRELELREAVGTFYAITTVFDPNRTGVVSSCGYRQRRNGDSC